ncbi:hypothetical protein IE077_003836 [Cardiosporidium cionae]|uniref:Little elongation complex subunit 2 C-terminal domain-containing protein n=1 Tax=Cardiosporidium cionae TaxID=476202 RepID=A0ABQ7JEM6_9APIC|nr:hypothetical protein IE077_003836 [Cardiosporidium cionae]|eukprot:KAF8822409.1 hypothetical protein IE077_003836 [Cardiosporidium cionae]
MIRCPIQSPLNCASSMGLSKVHERKLASMGNGTPPKRSSQPKRPSQAKRASQPKRPSQHQRTAQQKHQLSSTRKHKNKIPVQSTKVEANIDGNATEIFNQELGDYKQIDIQASFHNIPLEEKQRISIEELHHATLMKQRPKQSGNTSLSCEQYTLSSENDLTDHLREERDIVEYLEKHKCINITDTAPPEKFINKCKYTEALVVELVKLWCEAKRKQSNQTEYFAKRQQNEEGNLDLKRLEVYKDWNAEDCGVKAAYWEEVVASTSGSKLIEFNNLGVVIELPLVVSMTSTNTYRRGLRVFRKEVDWYNLLLENNNAEFPIPLSIRVDGMFLPSLPVNTKQWILKALPFRLMELSDFNTSGYPSVLRNKIQIRLPSSLIVEGPSLKVKFWDSKQENWSDRAIDNVTWDGDSHSVSFLSEELSTFSIMQKRDVDFPYKRWNIRPVNSCHVELLVETKRHDLKFNVTEKGISLESSCATKLGLQSLSNIAFNPVEILLYLRKYGINLYPNAYDRKKHLIVIDTAAFLETEEHACKDLAQIAPPFELESVPSLNDGGTLDGRIVVKIWRKKTVQDAQPDGASSPMQFCLVQYYRCHCKLIHQSEITEPNISEMEYLSKSLAENDSETTVDAAASSSSRWHMRVLCCLREDGLSANIQRNLTQKNSSDFIKTRENKRSILMPSAYLQSAVSKY